MKAWIVALAGALLLGGAAASAQPLRAVDAANAFRRALESGQREAALALLAPQLLVYESGEVNRSREHYAADHLDADLAFLANAKVQVLEQAATQQGDTAWVTTVSRIESAAGTLVGTETLVLRREAAGWRIAHIHWSSRRTKVPDG